jgi:hypothetical protein
MTISQQMSVGQMSDGQKVFDQKSQNTMLKICNFDKNCCWFDDFHFILKKLQKQSSAIIAAASNKHLFGCLTGATPFVPTTKAPNATLHFIT